jgi:hypothetical protein
MIECLNIPPDEIAFVAKTMSSTQIENELSAFEGNKTRKKGVPAPRYLVATTGSFGIGLTFPQVIAITLLEADYVLATQLQAFCRHDRFGNTNEATYSMLLYTEGNQREKEIMDKNETRKLLSGIVDTKRGSNSEEPIIL